MGWPEAPGKGEGGVHKVLPAEPNLGRYVSMCRPAAADCAARVLPPRAARRREKYWQYEYEEVITPNIYNFDLWKTSGHADHYKDNMFSFDIEKQEFGLKPMNCPGA